MIARLSAEPKLGLASEKYLLGYLEIKNEPTCRIFCRVWSMGFSY